MDILGTSTESIIVHRVLRTVEDERRSVQRAGWTDRRRKEEMIEVTGTNVDRIIAGGGESLRRREQKRERDDERGGRETDAMPPVSGG